ncbi:ER membrane protein complex subunit 5 isoform X1 [Lucilia cuprina]|uniref:ER membrane protein complex subunit 5 isoform X1 n=1 Tax=Lucilia cuprina TaxID=7375 RepID=UPI000C71C93C|nr:ER membrane protein complex subunit 5 isoform X1 [Lucilia cuprina]KAI8118655.1 Membrane magnesium transporter 1 [Lucilia cuprina]
MVNTVFNKFLLIAGFASLAHAAYSAAHYRTYLRLTEQEFTKLPLDIVVQIVVSLIVVIYNLIQIVGNFKEIRATVDMQAKSWDTFGNFPSFYSFNHRGKALSPNYVPEEEAEGKSKLDLNS